LTSESKGRTVDGRAFAAIAELERTKFVMKDGQAVRNNLP